MSALRDRFTDQELMGLAFAGVGAFFLLWGLWWMRPIRSSWRRVVGIVVGNDRSSSDGATSYRPIVEYEIDGQRQTWTRGFGTGSAVAEGTRYELAVHPTKPHRARMVRWTRFLVGLVLVLVAAGFAVGALLSADVLELDALN